MSRSPTHPIFNGPLAVELELEEVPTPPKYHYYNLLEDTPETLTTVKILEREWDTLNLQIGEREDRSTPGVVTTGDGFLDSPDMEAITGGIHLKGPGYVAIGRQGRLLQWGFYGTPEEMTETGRRLLINAIHYIYRFKDHPVLAIRAAIPRSSLATSLSLLDIYESEDMKEYYPTPEKVEEARKRNLENQFGEVVPAVVRGSKTDRQNWYRQNAPFLYWNGANVGNEYDSKVYHRLKGKFEVDEDARALGIANNDPALLRRAIEDLRKNADPANADPESAQRAQRLLTRYTGQKHDSAPAWQSWLEDNKDQLFASDWNGYRFQAARGPGEPDAESPARFAAFNQPLDKLSTLKRPAVDVALSVVADGEATRAWLDFKLEPGFWIYAPGSGAQFEFGVRAPVGFGYQLASEPILPQTGGQGRLYGDFSIEVPLDGVGDVATLLVDFQACDEKRCHLPVRDARLVAKVES